MRFANISEVTVAGRPMSPAERIQLAVQLLASVGIRTPLPPTPIDYERLELDAPPVHGNRRYASCPGTKLAPHHVASNRGSWQGDCAVCGRRLPTIGNRHQGVVRHKQAPNTFSQ